MSKGIFFISGICNHQGTHLQQLAADTVTTFNMIHELNWPGKHHTQIAACRMWRKETRTLCDESKDKMGTPLWQCIFDNNKYITSCQWFLYRNLHTLYYREYKTWCKYTRLPNWARRCIEFLTDPRSKSQRPYCSQVCRISLTSITTSHLQVEDTVTNFSPEPSGLHLDSAEE